MVEVRRAKWMDRFWAWTIDVLLLSILSGMILQVLRIPAISFCGSVILSALVFFYWTVLEGFRGQSFGKMVLNLEVIGSSGESIGFGDAAMESFGKAFLLPLDCLAGWVMLRGEEQRFFNRVSDTIVVYANGNGMGCSIKP
jgi:uncharacterized RDD family membrane protein YckC